MLIVIQSLVGLLTAIVIIFFKSYLDSRKENKEKDTRIIQRILIVLDAMIDEHEISCLVNETPSLQKQANGKSLVLPKEGYKRLSETLLKDIQQQKYSSYNEKLNSLINETYKTSIVIVRSANLFGPYQELEANKIFRKNTQEGLEKLKTIRKQLSNVMRRL